LGVNFHDHQGDAATTISVDLARVNARVKQLAADQSTDIAARLDRDGVRVITGRGRLGPDLTVVVTTADGEETLQADAIIVATGAAPRTLPTAQPDGERILTWEQVYDLTEAPTKLVVVGSGSSRASGTGAACVFHTSKESCPGRMGLLWTVGTGPSESTMALPFLSWPVTTRLIWVMKIPFETGD